MLNSYIDLSIALIMVWIAIEDFRFREVRSVLIILSMILFSLKSLAAIPFQFFLLNFLINFLLLSVQLILAYLMLKLKSNPVSESPLKKIGMGDILFMASLTLLFNPYLFVIVYLSGLLLGLIFYTIGNTILKVESSKKIPLMSCHSIAILVFLIGEHYFSGFSFQTYQFSIF